MSSFVLENDAVVEPSILIDEIELLPLPRETAAEPAIRVFQAEALALEPVAPDALNGAARRWADARAGGND